MATSYKRFIRYQFNKAKSAASDFITSTIDGQEERTIGLNPGVYAELKAVADQQQTTVRELVYRMIAQYLEGNDGDLESTAISVDQKEENPLLYLDRLCEMEDHREVITYG
jgi:hypothetical protein